MQASAAAAATVAAARSRAQRTRSSSPHSQRARSPASGTSQIPRRMSALGLGSATGGALNATSGVSAIPTASAGAGACLFSTTVEERHGDIPRGPNSISLCMVSNSSVHAVAASKHEAREEPDSLLTSCYVTHASWGCACSLPAVLLPASNVA